MLYCGCGHTQATTKRTEVRNETTRHSKYTIENIRFDKEVGNSHKEQNE